MRSHVSKLYQINLVLSENRLGYPREPSLVGISLAQSKIVFCATATAQETENFVSAVTSGATAIQDLSQRLKFVTTVTIEGNIGKDCGTIGKKGRTLGKVKEKLRPKTIVKD